MVSPVSFFEPLCFATLTQTLVNSKPCLVGSSAIKRSQIGGETEMKIIRSGVVALILALSLTPGPAFAKRHGHHAAMRVCKQNYKDAVRGAKYLRGPDRRARMEQARIERKECERLARQR